MLSSRRNEHARPSQYYRVLTSTLQTYRNTSFRFQSTIYDRTSKNCFQRITCVNFYMAEA